MGAPTLPLPCKKNPRSSRHSCQGRDLQRLAARQKIAAAIEGTAIAFMIVAVIRVDLSYQRLVAIFRRAALLATPLASIGLMGCPCPDATTDRIFLIRDPDAEMQALIDACRAPVESDCTPLCRAVAGANFGQFDHCELHQDRDGYIQVHVGNDGPGSCPGGRRPHHLTLAAIPESAPVGRFFAQQFQLEAASVPAFETLRRELIALDAPAALARAAAAAARDEIRHAHMTAALARRYGVEPVFPSVAPTPPRDLAAMADENVVEGCVREAFGALVAAVQSRVARDPVVRGLMAHIARDEARHAALAFAVHGWAAGRLGRRAAGRLADRRQEAIVELETHAGEGWSPALGAAAGLPGPGATRVLLRELRGALWV